MTSATCLVAVLPHPLVAVIVTTLALIPLAPTTLEIALTGVGGTFILAAWVGFGKNLHYSYH